MRHMKGRVDRLEGRATATLFPWHRVIVDGTETQETALAAYESRHGPIGHANLIVRLVVDPS